MLARTFAGVLLVGFLGACGGGGDAATQSGNGTVDVVSPPPSSGNSVEQATASLLSYLSSANDVKYQHYAAAAAANRVTYATSIGVRVTRNSALYQANKLAFEAAVRNFLAGFFMRLDEVAKAHPVDTSKLILELDGYQKNDLENMATSLSASAVTGVDTSVVSALYEASKSKMLTYKN